jgi:SAM-dependent methyltransferase
VTLDLATGEKLPVFEALLRDAAGPSLDLGAGLGYYSRHLLASAAPPVVALDLDLPALALAAGEVGAVAADALRLPFPDRTFGTVLLADVLEHCPDDAAVLREIARVTRPGGCLLLSVPSIEWGFPDFQSVLGIATVHDRPGPEQHHRPGYTAAELRRLSALTGFEVEEVRQIMRLGSKVLIDGMALCHLVVERLGKGRSHWTWGSLLTSPPPGLRAYRRIFPAIRLFHRLLRRVGPRRGFELVAVVRRHA